MKVYDIFTNGVSLSPENDAVIHNQRCINYRDLWTECEKMIRFLKSLELQKGSRIALLYENSIEYVIQFFAIFGAGYIAVPLDTSLKPENLNFIINDAAARVLLVHARYAKLLDRIIDRQSHVQLIVLNKKIDRPLPDIDPVSYTHLRAHET